MAVRVLQRDGELHLVPHLDAVARKVLRALAQLLGQVQLLLDHPPLLSRVLNHVVPVLRARPELPLAHLPLDPALPVPVRARARDALPDLQQPRLDVPQLEPLEQRSQAHLQRKRAAEHHGLLRDDDGVLDLVGPDVLDAHGVQDLEGRGLEGADNAQVLVGVDVGSQAAAHHAGLEAVGDGGLGDALERLARVAGHHVLEGKLVVARLEDHALGVAAHERLPPVLEDGDGLVDLVLRDARGGDFCLGESGRIVVLARRV